ncbi:MAG: RidA family protein [Candidatus Rokuibacteriota bacterium]
MAPVERVFLNFAKERSRGIDALKGTGVPAVFSDAVRVELPGCALLFVSGMVATDESGRVTARTMREQTRIVLDKIKAVLAREGGSMDDVVRVRVYVAQLDQASLREIHEVRAGYFTEGRYPASTLVRVDQLIRDGALIEIDADAVLDRPGPDFASA